MPSGFETLKDVLDTIAIPVALALLAALWPAVEGYYRRRRFQRLAQRELAELAPYPLEAERASWKDHAKKGMVHRAIVQAPSEHRDFLLSLNPSFVYYLTQLWAAYEAEDGTQWVHYLERLSEWGFAPGRQREIAEVHRQWRTLVDAYQERRKLVAGA